ncbi:sulfotransferase [Candidatus Villigracilis saccharophilus]|uniref:sulfotransferase n=1 Tax=Candidatus Villigracilis saccharophilus TaxID=3140684 RepID=UPI003136E33C|nr:sulfotransferase [Anaerolineales bacterium]
MNKNNPILVSGAHRSGTTWVGRMLAANPQTAYISEPLNVLHRRGVYRAEVDRWYTYITEENRSNIFPPFRNSWDFVIIFLQKCSRCVPKRISSAWRVTWLSLQKGNFSSSGRC